MRALFWKQARIDFADPSQQTYVLEQVGISTAEELRRVFDGFAAYMKQHNDVELCETKAALQPWVDYFAKQENMPEGFRKRVQYFALRLAMAQ